MNTTRSTESTCGQLPIAPSTYRARAAVVRDPERALDRATRDTKDLGRIECAHDGSKGTADRTRSGINSGGTGTGK